MAFAAAAFLAGCHPRANGDAPPGGVHAAPAEPVVLTAAHPSARVPLDPGALPRRTSVAEVAVAWVENPRLQAFSVRVRLVSDRGIEEVLGTFGPHPADQPGRFLLGVERELARVLGAAQAAPGAPWHLVFELLPVADDRPLGPPLEVHVGPVLWREAP